MFTSKYKNQVTTAERIQSDRFGRRLPLAGTDPQPQSAAPFDGGRVF